MENLLKNNSFGANSQNREDAETSSNGSDEKEPPDKILFVKEVDKAKYTCPHCERILRPQVKQTPCGHRLCGACVDDLFENARHICCPANEEDCETDIEKSQVSSRIHSISPSQLIGLHNYQWQNVSMTQAEYLTSKQA